MHRRKATFPSFSLVVPTVYGQMIVNRNDINQTNALVKTGCAVDHHEIMLLRKVAQGLEGRIEFLDIGANFGTYSLGLASVVDAVHSFEPQRIIHNMLAGSVALNGLTNVYTHNVAVGSESGRVEIPQFDYSKPLNFGSIEFGAAQTEALNQIRGNDPDLKEFVPLVTVDSFGFQHASLIKIDAEGMEMEVLDGAEDTIRRCRPVLYVEYIKVDEHALRRKIEDHGYAVHKGSGNYLCIPHERSGRIRVSESPVPA